MDTKTTSKTSCLKALLLRAWRERWSDLQWGINIKTVLPRGVSGDVYDLADCILQQAVVGSGANQLVLSYLKHSLSSQLVSHAAVLQKVSKFQQFHKVHCISSLLDFLEGILPGVTCCGKSEGTRLATALQSTTYWLLQILQSCFNQHEIYEKAVNILTCLLSNDFYVAMMCLAKYVEPETYSDIVNKCHELECNPDELGESLRILLKLDPDILNNLESSNQFPGCLIQSWLAVEMAKQFPTRQYLIRRLKLLQHLKNFSEPQLYSEIMRGSLISLYDVRETQHESQWGAFCFLNVPLLLKGMADKNDSVSICDAVELLLEPSPLLDTMDTFHTCSNLDSLLGEFVKLNLISETQKMQLLARHEKPAELKVDQDRTAVPRVIICAQQSCAGILKALSGEYKDSIIGILHQFLQGKTFELVLAVTTVRCELRTLVELMIRFNEGSKAGGDLTRFQLFDLTFIMVIAIVQRHGVSVLDGSGDSLIEKWIANCMVEPNHPKASEQMLKLCNPAIVETLLQHFNEGNADVTSISNIKWQDVLFNMSGVMKEVLIAWEQGSLQPADVQRILDAIRGKMCCVPLAAAAWVCAYMRTAPSILKPCNVLHQLLSTPPNAEDDTSILDRWHLTLEIIRNMQKHVHTAKLISTRNNNSIQPASEQLNNIWKSTLGKGWLDFKSASTLHDLLDTAGSRWLVTSVLQELLKVRYNEQLEKGADIALAIFHVDIKSCTIELLSSALPQILHNSLQADLLMEPQLVILARLTSYCVYAASNLQQLDEEIDDIPSKRSKIDMPSDNVLDALRRLLTTLETGMLDGQLPQQTYFTFELLKSIVEVKIPRSEAVLAAIPPTLGSQLLRTLPDSFSPGILLNLHDLHTTQGRSLASRDLCILRNYQLRNATI
ncbi:mediator of RNA polymerase II transcription subunit 24 [Onthophagus taurus]|uniref:mediator of RNA polymerase II transcription subunit 24 n=1 Tax=Onthophagus taurus TaxID=166361 RepID=UPI000C203151|nr:mediator of RNA polymerase II transcription subunit 24 [Onthophagus taurus]